MSPGNAAGFRQAIFLCALAVMPAVATALWHPRWVTRGVPVLASHEITLATVRQWGSPILWIDARPAADYRRSHVPGALPLDEAAWEQDLPAVLAAWSPDMKVVVYCGSERCGTSERVARRLRSDLGHDEVYYLRGGYDGWQTGQN